MILTKIDVTKIDKTKLFRGKKGLYLDVVLIPKPDEYGNDFMVVQSIPQEERLAGQKGAILGTAKQFKAAERSRPPLAKPAAASVEPDCNDLDF